MRIPAFLLSIGFLWACSTPPVTAPVPTVSKPAATPAKAKTERAEVPSLFDRSGDDYSYNPVGKRDPFMAYTEETAVGREELPRAPLEQYSLEQLKVTAIVWGITDPRALILAPDDQSYIVRKNMRMGNHRGRISKITRQSVFVEEEYRDPTGKLVVNEQEMEIRPEMKKGGGDLQLKAAEE